MSDNIVPIWNIDEDERKTAYKTKKPFGGSRRGDSVFRINKMDMNFIEGHIAGVDAPTHFYSTMNEYVTYFKEYLLRQDVYFSFDQVTLFKLVNILKETPLRLILKRVEALPSFKINTAFMIMPYGNEALRNFYENTIKGFLKKELGITVYRADDYLTNDSIIDQILELIEESEFIIADTTYENKNAFYELGYASAIGKEIITVQNEKVKELFFDRAHIRSIFYSDKKIEKFQSDLKGTIQLIRQKIIM